MSLDWWTESTGNARVPRETDEADVISGQAWTDFAEAVRRAGDEILRGDVPGSPLDRATGFRHLLILMHIAIDQQLDRSDPWYPSLGQISRTDLYKWGLDCPDAAYRGSAIKGDLTYRVWGNLGTVHYLSFQVNEGMRNHGNIRGDQLQTGPDGSFELWIGPDRHEGNWLRTPPTAGQLIIRQFFYDWDTEQAATLHIERVSGGDPPAGDDATFPNPARVARQLRGVGTFLNGMAKVWNDAEVEGQKTSRNAFQPATAKPETGGAEENITGGVISTSAPTRRSSSRSSRPGRTTGASTSATSGGSRSTTPPARPASTAGRRCSTTTACSAPSSPTPIPASPTGSTRWAIWSGRCCSGG